MITEWIIPWLQAWGLSACLMLLTWLYYLKTKVPSSVDVAWGLGITIVGLFFLHQHGWHDKSLLIGILLVLWGSRLSSFLYWTRIKPKEIDPRYQDLISNWQKKDLAYFFNYQLQAFLLLFITFPFYTLMITNQSAWQWTDAVACLLVALGILGEHIADFQLLQYKKTPQGPVCEKGLWRYSRHPNYFFEWLTWVGFSLFVIQHPYGWLALVSPVTLFIIMVFITGPITERNSIKSRGQAYQKYKKRTSMFFPWFPNKKGSQ